MKSRIVAAGLLMGLGACQPAPAPAPAVRPTTSPSAEASASKTPAGPDEPAASTQWDVSLDPLTLSTGGDGLSISCEEAKKVLRITFQPALEKEGPFDKAVIHFGDKSFPVTIDASGKADKYRPVYVLKADADTVSAVMLAKNARLVVTNQDGEQERTGEPSDNGSFDMFGTTCAQINGLR